MDLFFQRTIRSFARFIAVIFFRLRVNGLEHLKDLEPPFLIASNHIWRMDPGFIFVSLPFKRFPHICFVTHHRLMGIPVLGRFLRSFGCVPVRTGIGVERALASARAVLKNGGVVGIFPEGKMNRGWKFLFAKPGASYLARTTGVPVLPVFLGGTNKPSVKSILLRKQRASVTFGKPFFLEEKNDLAGAATIMRKIKRISRTACAV